MKQCKEIIKNTRTVDVCIYFVQRSIFVAKYSYPTHFKIRVHQVHVLVWIHCWL